MTRFCDKVAIIALLFTLQPVRAEEHGTLLLYFLQLPVGQETYELKTDENGELALSAAFDYTERGSRVQLNGTLRMTKNLSPLAFEAKGKSYRPFSVDAAVIVNPDGRTLTVRNGELSRQVRRPEHFFMLSGYTPLSVQMMMLRYWEGLGRPKLVVQFPGGTPVLVKIRGHENIEIDGKSIWLTRYSVENVVWGTESIWLNDAGEIAAVTTYAGGLPFEAIRSEYRAALPQLTNSSLSDRMHEHLLLARYTQPLVQRSFVIKGARLIDGKSAGPIEDAVVVVRDGRVAAAGPRDTVKVPTDIPVIDAAGQTLLPGLWEMHAHFAQVDYGPAYLAAGVTTARDCGGEFEFITRVRDLMNSKSGLGPTLILAGLVDRSGVGTFGTTWADTPEEGKAVVAKYKDAGFAQMKIYSRIKPDVLTAIANEAHRLGMTVTGHVPEGMTAIQGVEAGMDQINHFGPVMQAVRAGDQGRVIQFFKDHHTVIDPTMAWGELLGRPMDVDIASFEPGFAKAPYSLTSVIGTAGSAPGRTGRSNDSLSLIKALYDAGVPIVAGTDKAVPGHSVHRELELYVQAGLTPMQAIQIATSGAARVMGMEREVGTIEAGLRADMILVDGDPLKNFADLRKVARVITGGRMYDPAELWRDVGFRP